MGGPEMAPIPPHPLRDRAPGSIVLAVNPSLLRELSPRVLALLRLSLEMSS
jgi:hypothetical protein